MGLGRFPDNKMHRKTWQPVQGPKWNRLASIISPFLPKITPITFQISVMTKLVPSPDWFIGLDSLDLCSQGSFVDSVITEVSKPRNWCQLLAAHIWWWDLWQVSVTTTFIDISIWCCWADWEPSWLSLRLLVNTHQPQCHSDWQPALHQPRHGLSHPPTRHWVTHNIIHTACPKVSLPSLAAQQISTRGNTIFGSACTLSWTLQS